MRYDAVLCLSPVSTWGRPDDSDHASMLSGLGISCVTGASPSARRVTRARYPRGTIRNRLEKHDSVVGPTPADRGPDAQHRRLRTAPRRRPRATSSPCAYESPRRTYPARHQWATIVKRLRARDAAASSGRRREGEEGGDRRPASHSTFRPNPAAVRLGEMSHDRKAEAGTARLSRSRGIDAVEALEDSRHML